MERNARNDVTLVASENVTLILRLEGAAVAIAAAGAYHLYGEGWRLFAALFLLPDLGMLGYLAGPAFGAWSYNATHTSSLPIILGLVAWSAGATWVWGPLLIWIAHIGVDRALGYGLKYPDAFGSTHLGWIGRPGVRARR